MDDSFFSYLFLLALLLRQTEWDRYLDANKARRVKMHEKIGMGTDCLRLNP
ncbi:MAG: hypothetical protein GY786_04265 [Proteobacteria bacterium]|nr:hypothetical protein [Pseudomonadota bacterium]